MLVLGRNGVGKTNLLEALFVGSQGFSPRTHVDRRVIRFGAEAARVSLSGREEGVPVATDVRIENGGKTTVTLNGSRLGTAEELRERLRTVAFTPDRLALVKGGPLIRRTYLDRLLGRVKPVLARLPIDYRRVMVQRNRALVRLRAATSTVEAVEPWTLQLAELGTALERARSELVIDLAPRFEAVAAGLGLEGAALGYEAEDLTVETLNHRLPRDSERGRTSVGPHLRDLDITAGGRDLRAFGSQGEQRAGVLALALAEAELLTLRAKEPPLLLLDDVFSELDETRRAALVSRLPAGGQVMVTATDRPPDLDPSIVLNVAAGSVERV